MKRRLATLALILIAAAVLFAMQRTTPRYDELTGAIPVRAGMHETASTRLFDIEVQRVQFARKIAYRYIGKDVVLTTSGLWAIVTASLTARSESMSITRGFWDGPQGLRYEQSDRAVNPPHMTPIRLDPGLSTFGRFLFEIRPDQVGDATLVVWPSGLPPRLDAEAHIALDDLPRAADGALEVADLVSLNRLDGAQP
ncbi:hypothetical protein [Bordetella genomosp. 4]|nr:hypothetical protein [Bordetella genomosp. 4]